MDEKDDAKKTKKSRKVIKKILDKTEIDDKIIEHIDENRSLYNTILCYTKCYGGYLLALGAGYTFSANIWWGLGLTVAAGLWAWWVTHCNKKGGCKNG